jgi:hypothetical protein
MNLKNLALAALLLISNLMFSQKDSLILVNKDVLIGKIESMEKNILVFGTSYSDSDFKIKWHKVKEIYSDRTFTVTLTSGQRFQSTIRTDSTNIKKVILKNEGVSFSEDLSKVILLDPYGTSFFSRLEFNIDFGVTLTKANNFSQLSMNSGFLYDSNKWGVYGNFGLIRSTQDNTEDIQRMDAAAGFQWFLPKDWYAEFSVNFLSNNEQKIKLRTTLRLGPGYYFTRNNSLVFSASAGLALNNESSTDPFVDPNTSTEAYLGVYFNKYDINDFSVLTSIVFSPSLTEDNRFRTDFKLDLKYDLPWDLYVKVGATYNYDSQPVPGASKGDYVFETGFGWEWN